MIEAVKAIRAIEAVRREAFVQGFVAARDPKSAMETLSMLSKADEAYAIWRGAVVVDSVES